MPLGCLRGSGGVRGLMNLSWLRSAYSSRSFMASSLSSLDKAASHVSAEVYINLASWKALRINKRFKDFYKNLYSYDNNPSKTSIDCSQED